MAVSLKKPDKSDKVYLSKSEPELPRKLPEYTPVHLIDEEETIKSLREHLNTIDLDLGDLDDFIEKSEREERSTKILKIFSVVGGLVVAVVFVFLMIDCFTYVESDFDPDNPSVSSFIAVFRHTFSGVLDWFLTSPGGNVILIIFILSYIIRFIGIIRHTR